MNWVGNELKNVQNIRLNSFPFVGCVGSDLDILRSNSIVLVIIFFIPNNLLVPGCFFFFLIKVIT